MGYGTEGQPRQSTDIQGSGNGTESPERSKAEFGRRVLERDLHRE